MLLHIVQKPYKIVQTNEWTKHTIIYTILEIYFHFILSIFKVLDGV
jgi:hypothetical protein